MATHQVHLSLKRAARRPRMLTCLPAYAAVLVALGGLAGSTITYAAIRFLGAHNSGAIASGLAAAAAVMILAALLAGRLSGALDEFTRAARQVAAGDFRVRLPSGPTTEVALLTAAFHQMLAGLADDRKRLDGATQSLKELLRQRTAEAEERSRELESFLYAASHDLRAPVLSIQGFATLLAQSLGRRLDAQSQEHLARIRANAEAMDLLLRDLLEVSRVGRVQEATEWVDSGEIVASVLRDLEPEILRLHVRVNVSDGLPVVAYSPRLLARVFRNLVDNAIKFMGDQPAPRVAIGCERIPQGHRFWVQDNGVGISSQDHEKIFGLFTRADGSRAPGSGIGLAIVRRIIETYRGRVWVQSEPGVGSTFNFTIPAASPRTETADEPPS